MGFIGLNNIVLLALSPRHFFLCLSHAFKFLLPLDEFILTLPSHVSPALRSERLMSSIRPVFSGIKEIPSNLFQALGTYGYGQNRLYIV